MTEDRDPKAFLAERLRAADPTSLKSYRLLDLLFKIVQWTVFSGLIQAIGLKTSNRTLSLLGAFLLVLVVFFVWQATMHVLNGIYRPSGFATKLDRGFAYAISGIALLGAFSFLGMQIMEASSQVVSFYLGKP